MRRCGLVERISEVTGHPPRTARRWAADVERMPEAARRLLTIDLLCRAGLVRLSSGAGITSTCDILRACAEDGAPLLGDLFDQPPPSRRLTGDEIRGIRQTTGLAQTDFARRIGIAGGHASMVSIWEGAGSGPAPISRHYAERIEALSSDAATENDTSSGKGGES